MKEDNFREKKCCILSLGQRRGEQTVSNISGHREEREELKEFLPPHLEKSCQFTGLWDVQLRRISFRS